MFEPPSDPERPVGEPPATRPSGHWAKRAGGAAVGFGVLAAKFKWLLLIAFKTKFLLSGISLVVMVWWYTLFFGVKYAIAIVMLIAIHEFGHVFFVRVYGLPGGMPYFIPGLGGLTTLGARPASAYDSAWIAFGGPLFGGAGALLCLSYGMIAGEPFWYAAANFGFLINLFNLMPVPPFDGGRIVEAVSPRIWVAGMALLAVAIVVFQLWRNPLVLILIVLSLPQVRKAFKGEVDPTYNNLTLRQRVTVGASYFAMAAVLALGMLSSAVSVPGHSVL